MLKVRLLFPAGLLGTLLWQNTPVQESCNSFHLKINTIEQFTFTLASCPYWQDSSSLLENRLLTSSNHKRQQFEKRITKKQRWNSQTWDTVSADITAELNTVLKQLAVVGVLEEGEPVAPSLGLAEFKTSELIRGVGAADKDALSTFSFLEAFCTTVEGWKSRNPFSWYTF